MTAAPPVPPFSPLTYLLPPKPPPGVPYGKELSLSFSTYSEVSSNVQADGDSQKVKNGSPHGPSSAADPLSKSNEPLGKLNSEAGTVRSSDTATEASSIVNWSPALDLKGGHENHEEECSSSAESSREDDHNKGKLREIPMRTLSRQTMIQRHQRVLQESDMIDLTNEPDGSDEKENLRSRSRGSKSPAGSEKWSRNEPTKRTVPWQMEISGIIQQSSAKSDSSMTRSDDFSARRTRDTFLKTAETTRPSSISSGDSPATSSTRKRSRDPSPDSRRVRQTGLMSGRPDQDGYDSESSSQSSSTTDDALPQGNARLQERGHADTEAIDETLKACSSASASSPGDRGKDAYGEIVSLFEHGKLRKGLRVVAPCGEIWYFFEGDYVIVTEEEDENQESENNQRDEYEDEGFLSIAYVDKITDESNIYCYWTYHPSQLENSKGVRFDANEIVRSNHWQNLEVGNLTGVAAVSERKIPATSNCQYAIRFYDAKQKRIIEP